MQLGSRKKVATSLFAATSALLGAPSGPSIAQESEQGWRFDTSFLYYGEPQRVTDLSANVRALHWFRRGLLTLRLTVDSLTGASASGAAPSVFPQTFTTPSGNGSYRVDPGATPLDPSFLDTRVAASANWTRSAGSRGEMDFGLSASNEYDYLHAGANARYSLGLNQRNTTLGFGVAFASDTVSPVGGAPVPFSAMLPSGQRGNKLGDDRKRVTDLLFGVTQVLGPRTVGELQYSFSRSDGYLTDPYKVLTVVDPLTGDPDLYRFESRPDGRTKHSLYGQVKHRFGRPIVDASYRFMTDDWGVSSHTLDAHWRQPVGERWYVQPHLRYYVQTAADFYRPSLVGGQALPDHASADYRLGELDGATLGIKVGRALQHDREWSVRVEYYRQSGRAPPGAQIGSLAGLDLFPTVDAAIAQFQVRFWSVGETTLRRAEDYWTGRFQAMASPCQVLMEVDDRREAERLLAVVATETRRIETKYSRYLPGNVVHQINHAEGRLVEVDEETARLLDYAARLHALSEGRFDVTSGVLRRVWRFDGSDRVPSPEAVEEVRSKVGWTAVRWDGLRIGLRPGMELDLGGIGKEYAADRAAGLIRDGGSCLVNLGGDLVVTRARRDGRPWLVGIESPHVPEPAAARLIQLTAGALATSGDARRFLLKDGIRYGHILDPTTGWPVREAPRSVTVAAGTCLDAGMLATFAMLQGRGAEAFLEAQGVRHWVLR